MVLGGEAVSYERGTPVGAYDLLGVKYDPLATRGIPRTFELSSGRACSSIRGTGVIREKGHAVSVGRSYAPRQSTIVGSQGSACPYSRATPAPLQEYLAHKKTPTPL